MELQFLGTSSGRTFLNRYHSSLIIKNNDKIILIDTGDSVSRALLKQSIEFNSITDIIISHYHSDHLAGLPSLLTQMIILKRKDPLNIYTHTKLLKSLNSLLELSYIFLNKIGFKINLIGFEFRERIPVADSFYLNAEQNSHITNKHKILNSKVNFISSSFLFEFPSRTVIYTSDIGISSDLYLFRQNMSDILITEATHLPFSELEKLLNTASHEKIYLTHIDNESAVNDWHSRLPENKKEKFILAVDGMSISI